MSTWVIISWVLVAILTAINVAIFLKLKGASEQMLKAAFPGMDMNQAMAQMQKMMGGMGVQGMARGGRQGAPGHDAQLRAAMQMLQQQGKKKR